MQKLTIYSVNGYFKDDKENPFEGYNITDSHNELPRYKDCDIFFYGMSKENLEEAIELCENTAHDFVVTSFELSHTICVFTEKEKLLRTIMDTFFSLYPCDVDPFHMLEHYDAYEDDICIWEPLEDMSLEDVVEQINSLYEHVLEFTNFE